MAEVEFVPAEVFPPGEYIEEEMQARHWTEEAMAARMGGPREYAMNLLCLKLILAVRDTHVILDAETAAGIGRAFGTSTEVWLNLDAEWRKYGPPSKYATAH